MVDVKRDRYGRPRVFLEGTDIPVEELGIECQRERGASSALPPLYFLHVWWARRPLTVSRAAILGSLLPEGFDKTDFLELMGIPKGKNPVKAKQIIDEVKAGLRKRVSNPYGYERAFKNNLSEAQLKKFSSVVEHMWGYNSPTVLDSFAGGGSIPFEAKRLGLNVVMNELNPVASIIERATIEYPSLFGKELVKDIKKWGERIEKIIEGKLADCFPRNPGEKDLCYIWVRTVTCPQCKLRVPLSPNWWLDKTNKIGYKLVLPESGDICSFEICKQSDSFNPDEGTVTGGKGKCPRCFPGVIEGEEIKRQAKKGEMGHQLAAIGYKMKGRSGRHFREVTEMDLEGVRKAEEMLKKKLPAWRAKGLVPDEDYPKVTNDPRPLRYSMEKWHKFFNPRQLLVHLTTLEAILNQPWDEIEDEKKREALQVYMQMALDKTIDYNSLQSRLHTTRTVMVNTFDRHDFSFKWSYGEIDGSGQLFNWGISQIADAYEELAELIGNADGTVEYMARNAADLSQIDDKSIDAIVIDPPYYDNVMYAECSDFFYVWMKRGLGDVFPELFPTELTNKEDEAVANKALFEHIKGKRQLLAERDYEAKMAAAFREMHRVLRDDGVMTVMFTHKRTEAWDALARGLMDSGFEITAAWPVHTESEHSLHQAKKNAAASTILLVCRKRPENNGTGWWEELRPVLEEKVLQQAEVFERQGIRRLDLSIACFGTALETISEKWPVKRGDGTVISPDDALDAARSVVSQWFMDKITRGERKAVDPATQFYILAWYVFQAREFPFDEARKLSLSVGFSIDDLKRKYILERKGNNVRIMKPMERARKGGIKAGAQQYKWDIDYVHAAMLAYEAEGTIGLKRFHQKTDAMERPGYRHTISYLLDILPRTSEVDEYFMLENMWQSTYRDDIKRKTLPRTDLGLKQTKLTED